VAIDAEPVEHGWLSGVNEPVHDELDVPDLEVTGWLPDGLRGHFLRNGPNPQFPPIGGYHLFDGDGMVHGLWIDEDGARYRNRWVESRGLLAERKRGHALYGGLSHFVLPDPEVAAEGGMLKNTANTALVHHAGLTLALLEATLPTSLGPELQTLGEHDFGGRLQGAMTAHPKLDPVSGEMLFFGYGPFPPYLRYHEVDAEGVLVHSVDLDLPRSVMMHDFVVTEGHAVFFDLPAVFDVQALMSGQPGITWQPQHGARIGVLPRRGRAEDVRWVELDPFYVFHFLNGWDEEDGTVTVVGCRNERMPVAFGDDVVEGPVAPTLHRWTIDPVAGTVTESALDDRPGDFPRVAPTAETRQGRYGYVAVTDHKEDLGTGFTGMAKHDLQAGTSEVHELPSGFQCGEAVFAPDPAGTAEDDGWLLNLVIDRSTRDTDLWVLDARDVTAEPVAKVHLPRRVPAGFHGTWIPT